MRITILGTRGNVPPSAPRHCRHSGILIDDYMLLDLGEPAYLRRGPRHVFITHLHADHAVFLERAVVTDAAVYVPEATRALLAAHVIHRPIRLGAYRVVPVPTEHSARVRSVGYVVEKGRRRVFFSSDLIAIDPRYRGRLGRLDLVITDGSYLRRGGLVRVDPASGRRSGHAGIPDLVDFFGAFTARIVITHFGSWFYRDVVRARRAIAALGDGVVVRAAFDGMTLSV